MHQAGEVLDYNYLWKREAEAGEESGRKARPVCVLLAIGRNPSRLYLYPITTQRPAADRTAVDIPDIERRRAGLDQPSWLILDEFNRTDTDALYDFESLTPRGAFSTAFTKTIAAAALLRIAQGKVSSVRRT
jgi:hypothetical protein